MARPEAESFTVSCTAFFQYDEVCFIKVAQFWNCFWSLRDYTCCSRYLCYGLCSAYLTYFSSSSLHALGNVTWSSLKALSIQSNGSFSMTNVEVRDCGRMQLQLLCSLFICIIWFSVQVFPQLELLHAGESIESLTVDQFPRLKWISGHFDAFSFDGFQRPTAAPSGWVSRLTTTNACFTEDLYEADPNEYKLEGGREVCF